MLRRSVTLADQLAAVGPAPSVAVAGPGGAAAAGSCNLRDLLKLRDEDDLASAGRRAAVTLASAMAAERQVSAPSPSLSPPSSSSPATAAAAAAARTLLDIIRDDQPPASGPSSGDPLVRRAVSLPPPTTATASPPAPALAAAEAAPAPPPPPPAAAAADEEEEQEQRVSLMALLEQTDRQWSAVPGATTQPEEEEEDSAALEALEPVDDDAELEPEAAGRGVVAGYCCVCMARAKGAAFIPCGHTFCRACARELLAGRGRCPLCNAAIVDVLDIF